MRMRQETHRHGVLPMALPKQPRQGRTHKERVPLVEEVRAVLVQEAHVAQLPVLRVRIGRAPLQLGQRDHRHARVRGVAHDEEVRVVAQPRLTLHPCAVGALLAGHQDDDDLVVLNEARRLRARVALQRRVVDGEVGVGRELADVLPARGALDRGICCGAVQCAVAWAANPCASNSSSGATFRSRFGAGSSFQEHQACWL